MLVLRSVNRNVTLPKNTVTTNPITMIEEIKALLAWAAKTEIHVIRRSDEGIAYASSGGICKCLVISFSAKGIYKILPGENCHIWHEGKGATMKCIEPDQKNSASLVRENAIVMGSVVGTVTATVLAASYYLVLRKNEIVDKAPRRHITV